MDALAITERFAEEVGKTELGTAEIARRTGIDADCIRDVLHHKQPLPAEILARSAALGIDLNYVLTGARPAVSPHEQALITHYRHATSSQKDQLEAAGNALAQPSSVIQLKG
jgi:hypothetical protein